ncbi:TraR/DksA family transcriptional regulator [Nitrospirota bacterium]
MPKKGAKTTSASKPKSADAKKKTQDSSEDQTETLRRNLKKLRDSILEESRQEIIKSAKGETRKIMEEALDTGDWSVIENSESIKHSKLNAHRKTLFKVEESLLKISEGSYGTCDDCEEEINPERLRILPFAIRCRDCQEDFEEQEEEDVEPTILSYNG